MTNELISLAQNLGSVADSTSTTITQLTGALVSAAASLTDVISSLPTGVDATALTNLLTQLQGATPSLQTLANLISKALGISAPSSLSITTASIPGSGSGMDQAIEVQLNLQENVSPSLGLSSLNNLAQNLGPLMITGTGSVQITVTGSLNFDFGFDLTNPGVFLMVGQNGTQISLQAQITSGSGFTLSAGIGGVKLSIGTSSDPASVTLENTAGTGPANVAITTTSGSSSNVVPLGDLTLSNFQFSGIDGHLKANLPLFIGSTSLGDPITVDLDLSDPTNPNINIPSNLGSDLINTDFDFSQFTDGITGILDGVQSLLQNQLAAAAGRGFRPQYGGRFPATDQSGICDAAECRAQRQSLRCSKHHSAGNRK